MFHLGHYGAQALLLFIEAQKLAIDRPLQLSQVGPAHGVPH